MKALRLLLLLASAGCAGDYTTVNVPPVPPPLPPRLPGEPAQYICLRHHVSLGCVKSEWRCSAPLQMRAGIDGTPRCVMPGNP